MNKASYPLKLPASLKAAAQRLAREDGVSLNQWIAVAVAEKVGAVETAADFFERRRGSARPEDMLVFLDQAGSESPPPEDEQDVNHPSLKGGACGTTRKPGIDQGER